VEVKCMKMDEAIHVKYGLGKIENINAEHVTVVFTAGLRKKFLTNSFHEYFEFNNQEIEEISKKYKETKKIRKMMVMLKLSIKSCKYQDALEIGQLIIEADRSNVKAWSFCALAYLRINDHKNAMKICRYILDKLAYRNQLNEDVDRLVKIETFINSIKNRAVEVVEYKSNGIYRSHCYNCKSDIDENMPKCKKCGWFICLTCGNCGCQYDGSGSEIY